MKYMLGTDICIYMIKHYKEKRHTEKLLSKIKTISVGDIAISSITFSELLYGVEKSQHQSKNKAALMQFVMPLEIISFDDIAALHYSEVRASLESKGKPVGAMDLLIAAHARSLGLVIVTNNTKEFKRVPKLSVENWLRD